MSEILMDKMLGVAWAGFQNHMKFRDINGMDVDMERALRAALLAAANRGYIRLTDPGAPELCMDASP